MFEWQKENGSLVLVHTARDGSVKRVEFRDVNTYVANLHASERQSPLPPFPLEDAALEAAGDVAIKAAADSNPDPLRAAVAAALARAEACMLAADASAEKAGEAATGAWQALRDLHDLAAELAPREPEPAPVSQSPQLAVIEGQGAAPDVIGGAPSDREAVARTLTPPL